MSDVADVASALLAQVTKLVKTMSDDEVKRVVSGESKLVVQPRGHRVMEMTPALDKTLKVVQQMSADDLRQVEQRQARVVLLRKGEKIISPLDPAEVAAQVAKQTSEAEVIRLLDADSRLNATNLKRVAAELNVAVPPSVKGKPAIQLHIAQQVVGDRSRWSWR